MTDEEQTVQDIPEVVEVPDLDLDDQPQDDEADTEDQS